MVQGKLIIGAVSLAALALMAAIGWSTLKPLGRRAGWLGLLTPVAIVGNGTCLAFGQFSLLCMGLISLQWILLARRRAGSALVANGDLDRWRAGLNGHTLTLGDMLAEGDLELACDDLAHFSHWITPEFMPKRFDTHFYLARVPVDQVAGHDGHENVDSVWITPRQVIEDANEKRRTVIFPTLSNVVRLSQYGSVAEAFSAAQTATIVPIRPWMEDRADGKYVCIPTDAGFALTEQKASR